MTTTIRHHHLRIFTLLIMLSFVPGSAKDRSEAKSEFEWSRPAMGTVFRIKVWASSRSDAEDAVHLAFNRIEELESKLSFYKSESELNRLSADGFHRPVNISTDLLSVLEESLFWSRKTGGAFDCTVRPLVDLWHQHGSEGRIPPSEDIQVISEKVGYQKILINSRLGSVRLLVDGMKLDLGGIAKGFAADQAIVPLERAGFKQFLIDAGGDLRIGDPPPGREGWRISIDTPGNLNFSVQIHNVAIATSGDKYRFYEINGTRYSHIVHPVTGLGLTHHRQVTVIAPDAATADALATALSVMDIKAGLSLIETLDRTEALIQVDFENGSFNSKSGKILRSSGFPRPR